MNLRRTILALGGIFASGLGKVVIAQPVPDATPYTDKAAMASWMDDWMSAAHAAAGALHLGRFADAMYFLREEIQWSPNPGQGAYKNVRVPVGFVTDFTSIPRVFWSALPKDGLYTYPAIIHDYLYWEQPVSREDADTIFRFAMEDFKVGVVAKNAIYSGVRLGGSIAWDDNARRKKSGEKRILKIFPQDPTTKWIDFQKNPSVF